MVFALDERIIFPDPKLAEPEGLLAIGGDLSYNRLLLAYQQGLFPWYNPDEPILWWCPDPRCVLFPKDIKFHKSLRPIFNQNRFSFSINKCFDEVIERCGSIPRRDGLGTWVSPEIIEAYTKLHLKGYAHSVEVWQENELIGGLYGIAMGKMFFGESMFSAVPNASKAALVWFGEILEEKEFILIDCQIYNEHLAYMGATEIPREEFLDVLANNPNERVCFH